MPHRPLVLDGGLDVRRLGGNQTDMEFVGALQWSVEEVSRAFKVPKAFLSEYAGVMLTIFTVMGQLLWPNTVIQKLRMLEDGFNRGVAAGCETEGEQLEVRFDLTGIEAARESEAAKWNNFRSSSKTAL